MYVSICNFEMNRIVNDIHTHRFDKDSGYKAAIAYSGR